MAERCERTDLLVTDCAHCRDLPDLDAEEIVVVRRGTWFTALYGGRCANCKTTFEAGDQIRADGYGNGGWLAECCREDDDDA
jgi:hypothetical protein